MSKLPGRMTRFRIDEISGVPKPAQEGARAVIMKSDARDVPVDWTARRGAVRAGLEALAKDKARVEGTTFAKAYDALLVASPELARVVI